MKRFIILLMALYCGASAAMAKTNFYESDLFKSLTPNDKVAILMVHFGTSHDDTRAKTIDALNSLVAERYPDIELREAWTSRMIINIRSRRGEDILNPEEALTQLHDEGYTHIIIQSSNIIEGVEMESLRRDALAAKGLFKEIRIGNPLLYTTRDYEVVVDALRDLQPRKSALVLVGHGTYTPATAQYAMVDYVIGDRGYGSMYISTIEGYPDFASLVSRLARERVKKVTLMPFMFVAGEHAKSDIAGDWAEALSEIGYDVDVTLRGLGEMERVQELLIEHIEFAIENQMYDIIEKKSSYSAEGNN